MKKTLEVNTLAHLLHIILFIYLRSYTVKTVLPEMIRRNSGHIVTVASAAGHMGVSGLVDYCASKFAAVGFDESLR